MPAIAASEVIDPKQLTTTKRQQLTDDLYRVHCQIFEGVDRDSFAKYVVESKAQQTAIHVHKNTEGAVVGYFALHIFEKELRSRPVAVFRAEAGTLREYRGNNTNVRIAVNYLLRYWLSHPTRPLFYLGTLVHPSSYMGLAKYASLMWPHRTHLIANEIAAFMSDLAVAFGLEAVEPANPLVVQVGWRTRDTEMERAYWRICDKPDARFFVQENPHYGEGQGLMTLVSLSGAAILRTIGQVAREQSQRRLEPMLAATQQLPLARQLFGLREIQRRLQHTELFANLPADQLGHAARAAEVLTLPAGRYVFRAGDVGDELFVIASGAAYVLTESAGEEKIIDQLATGELFGEIAMLSGEPRTASIRTATKTTLIRLKRKALLALMETHLDMRKTIWGAYARRRFADLTAGRSPHFGALSRQQRLDWFARGQHQQLAAQEQATITEPWLFVLTGAVELQGQNAWSTLRAPALIQVTDSIQITAQAPAQYVRLPEVEQQ